MKEELDRELVARSWFSGEEQRASAELLGILISVGIPILECLTLCENVFGNPRAKWMFRTAHDRVREGESLAGALIGDPLLVGAVDPDLFSIINVGEETGELDVLLARYAERKLTNKSRPLGEYVGLVGLTRVFTEGLAFLMQTGLPLERSLEILSEDPQLGAAKDEIRAIRERVHAGDSLSVAMEKAEATNLVFGTVYLKVIYAGEIGGVLDVIIDRLSSKF